MDDNLKDATKVFTYWYNEKIIIQEVNHLTGEKELQKMDDWEVDQLIVDLETEFTDAPQLPIFKLSRAMLDTIRRMRHYAETSHQILQNVNKNSIPNESYEFEDLPEEAPIQGSKPEPVKTKKQPKEKPKLKQISEEELWGDDV